MLCHAQNVLMIVIFISSMLCHAYFIQPGSKWMVYLHFLHVSPSSSMLCHAYFIQPGSKWMVYLHFLHVSPSCHTGVILLIAISLKVWRPKENAEINLCLPGMKEAAGDCMWRPTSEDWGDWTGTNEPGEGTWSCGLPGEVADRRVPGEGVPIKAADGEGFTCK